MEESQEPSPLKPKRPSNTYLKYSGLAIQILATIVICGWLGYKVDQWAELKFPAFMLGFGFLGFAGIIYKTYRSINRE